MQNQQILQEFEVDEIINKLLTARAYYQSNLIDSNNKIV